MPTQNNERKILEKIFYLIVILTAIIAPVVTLRERVIRLETKIDALVQQYISIGKKVDNIERVVNGRVMILPDLSQKKMLEEK